MYPWCSRTLVVQVSGGSGTEVNGTMYLVCTAYTYVFTTYIPITVQMVLAPNRSSSELMPVQLLVNSEVKAARLGT